ncbi:MAG: LacI family transcriptional regulator [Bryobacterales bacterium]|nr:LacI family transcriptional regulator [Bryobacterales bacterium]
MRRRSSSPTMKDIASRANVSVGTVSRVLNRHEDVDLDLRERVETAARKLGYRLSARTRSVVQTKAGIIGLILFNDFGLSPAQALLLLGVEEYCSSAGYHLLFVRHRYAPSAPAASLDLPPVMQTPGLADCIIMAGTLHENTLATFERHGLNYVALANHTMDVPKGSARRHFVEYDDLTGCCEATCYLGQLGHKDIWYIGDASRPWHRNRFRGYSRAIAEMGLDPHVHTIALSDDEFENGQAAVVHILEQGWPITAILAGSDELAYGAREGLRQHRREVPKDVSLVGFENERGRARGSNLTSVFVDMAEVGRQLAKAAIAQIEDREKAGPTVVVPTQLVKRSTCRPIRKEDQMML